MLDNGRLRASIPCTSSYVSFPHKVYNIRRNQTIPHWMDIGGFTTGIRVAGVCSCPFPFHGLEKLKNYLNFLFREHFENISCKSTLLAQKRHHLRTTDATCTESIPLAQTFKKTTPLAQTFNKTAPLAQKFNKSTPLARKFNKLMPLARKFSKSTPIARKISKSTPIARKFNKLTPLSQNFNKSTPFARKFNKLMPLARKFNKSTPLSQNFNKSKPITQKFAWKYRLMEGTVVPINRHV